MKTNFALILLVLSLVATGVLWHRVNTIEAWAAEQTTDYPLGEMMGYMQRYADKLWHAGQAGNWELAQFYQGEIAETVEDISHAKVVKEGVEVSTMLRGMLPPVVDSVGQAVAARDPARFRSSYQTMVTTCNACHQGAKRPFIQVAVPTGQPTYWNQKF